MWRKEDGRPQGTGETSTDVTNSKALSGTGVTKVKEPFGTPAVSAKASACVSQGIKIKGDITGTEDLFVDGQIEGKVDLGNAVLTIGPNATVKADVTAREIVVRGQVNGKLDAAERIQVWHSARISGDLKAEKIAIEEGAELHGKMEAGKAPVKSAETTLAAKKPDGTRAKEISNVDEKPASGAAVAGAD
jgi:cytoskeletal protein CcmA (bactofilin family)